MPDSPTLLTAAVILLDVAAGGLLLYRARGVERTLAWLFAILAFPGVGALAYFALVSQRVGHVTRRRLRARRAIRDSVRAALPAAAAAERVEPREERLLCLATALSGVPPASGTAISLLVENDRAFERIEAALAAARSVIWAEYYIIRRDTTGSRFLDLLAERARAGVEVRLLFDAFGSLSIDAARLAALRAAGGQAHSFLPLNPLRRRWSFHLRNHRKLIVVDGETGFTGGMNIGDEYSGRGLRRRAALFRDSHLELHGPAVAELAQVFAEDWTFATGALLEPLPPADPVPGAGAVVAVVPSAPEQEPNASALLFFAAVAGAHDRVWMATPYFVPDEPTLWALESAALRGLDVRLIVPRRTDVALAGPAARSNYRRLLAAGVCILEYLPSVLHSKMTVIDSRVALVGSANIDVRSFRLNFELGTLVIDPGLAAAVEAELRRVMAASERVTVEQERSWSALVRLGHGAARLFSPLL